MPSIKIFEQDLTTGGGRDRELDIVYVPGFMSHEDDAWPKNDKKETDYTYTAKAYTPILCSSVSEFESYFGKKPAVFTSGGERDVDVSYVYAKELLSLGLPVLYESVNGKNDNGTGVTLPERNSLIAAINNGDIFDKLADKRDYQFKYLTSGGYPLFSVDSTSESSNSSEDKTIDIDINLLESFTQKELTMNHYKLVYNGGNVWSMWEQKKEDDGTPATDDSEKPVYVPTEITYDGDRLITEDDEYTYVITEEIYDSTTATTAKNTLLQLTAKESDTVIKDYGYIFNKGDSISIDIEGEEFEATFTSIDTKPSSNTYQKMTNVAYTRGDCIAIIDHVQAAKPSEVHKKVTTSLTNLNGADLCTLFTPWVNVNCATYKPTSKDDTILFSMPPSFGYLSALAKSISTNASWLAVAGASRGQIPNLDGETPLDTTEKLTNSLAESFQNRDGISINAITEIKPFGYRIWGNRTLKNNSVEGNLTATSFLNTRNMICDIKKVVYEACRKYTFEQNNDVLWLNFKSYIEPTLDKMKTGAGLSGYKIIKGETTEKAKLVASIKLYPLYAVEDFEITVKMLDDEIAVS